MTLEEINRAVQLALEALAAEPSGHLLQPHRTQLLETMGPFRPVTTPLDQVTVPQHRRALLSVAAARRVVPVYERLLPGEQDVQEVLELAERRLAGVATWQECHDKVFPLDTMIFGMPGEGEWILPAMYVAQAASEAMSTAMGDSADIITECFSDDRVDRWDAGMYAAWASALGDPWRPANEQEVAAIRNYWTWFITEAFPAACRAVPG